MPQKDMSSRIGSSPSPSIQRVIDNNKNVQKPGTAPAIAKDAFNKKPVSVK